MLKRLPKPSKNGFDLPGGKAHLLLLHGYTGSPYDLRPLANYLCSKNIHVLAPLLAGHGKRPSVLKKVHLKQWIHQAQLAVSTFDKSLPILVGGLSMGAFLAILVASQNPAVKGVLLFSPAFKLNILAEIYMTSVALGILNKNGSLKKFGGESDILDPNARKLTPAYKEMPVAGLLEFRTLRALALDKLPGISCPIFMGFGRQDSTLDVMDCHEMVVKRTSVPFFSKFYENSKHVMTLDYDREELCKDVFTFISKRLGI